MIGNYNNIVRIIFLKETWIEYEYLNKQNKMERQMNLHHATKELLALGMG